MNPQHFLDTNVLIYAATGKVADPRKYQIANGLVSDGRFAISAQVLGEFYSDVRYLQHEKLGALQAQEWIQNLLRFCQTDVDSGIISTAAFYRERYKIQFWDAALIAASEKLGLKTLYTEDLSHGQKYGSVTAINPFKAA